MKKLTFFLFSLALVFSVAGYASALSFNVEQNYNDLIVVERFTDTFYFPNLDPAAASITSASFSITHRGNVDNFLDPELWVAKDDDNLFIGTLRDSPDWTTDTFLLSSYVINGIMSNNPWSFILRLNERTWDPFVPDQLTLRTAIFAGDYTADTSDNNPAGVAPVPEPSTILLLGTGLLGLVAIGRRKFNPEQ